MIQKTQHLKPKGLFKRDAEDFVVDEVPAYLPSGEGEHLYLHVQKTHWATDELVHMFANGLQIPQRDIGFAGMKDKHAVTTQYLSLPCPPRTPDFDATVARLALPEGVRLLSMARHGNKLRTGHLRGNRFALRIRDVQTSAFSAIAATFARLEKEGVPNHFGPQRFGRGGRNAEVALSFLRGDSAKPRDSKQARFLFSALQSSIFNQVLDARIIDGSWNTPIRGDLLVREAHVLGTSEERGRGAMFLCEDEATDRTRATIGEVSPTGPIPGAEMRAPEGMVRELEERLTQEVVGAAFSWDAARRLGEGTRRSLRLWIEALELQQTRGDERSHQIGSNPQLAPAQSPADPGLTQEPIELSDVWVSFVLPKGAYATTVLAAVFDLEEPAR
jgi:tRNA pseudouridine13 synthase